MGKDEEVRPVFAITLLASLVIGGVYWTGIIARGNDAYYDTFSNAMDAAIDQAYGLSVQTQPIDK